MDNFRLIKEIEKIVDYPKLAITYKEIDAKSRKDISIVCSSCDFNIDNLTSNIQIHSDIVNIIDENNIGKKIEGDALVTNIKRVPLLIFTADCVPIAFIDTKNKAIGAAHAGWKGTYSKIAKKTIEAMISNYGTRPQDVVCVIGPSIGPCCYEVSKELVEKFNTIITNKDEKIYIIKEDKYFLDLWKINEDILKECGVKNESIINLNLCTSCNENKFHSYRVHNNTDKRIGMILEIR